MIALLLTRCGCRKYITIVPWDNMREIILPLSPDYRGIAYHPENRPRDVDGGVEERRFEYRESQEIQGEKVAVYRERA